MNTVCVTRAYAITFAHYLLIPHLHKMFPLSVYNDVSYSYFQPFSRQKGTHIDVTC